MQSVKMSSVVHCTLAFVACCLTISGSFIWHGNATRSHHLTASVLNGLDKDNQDIRSLGILGEACWANIWMLSAIAAALGIWLLASHAKLELRWQQAILASMAAILAACVIISVVTGAQSTALLATDMTLSKGLLKAGKVYGLAEEALMGVQKELENRLKPSQQLQDSLYQAKDGLPVPPDPIKNALDAFAKQALGDIVAPAAQVMQDAMQKGLDTQAASLTESNAALAQLIAQLEQLGAGSPTQQLQEGSLLGMRGDADRATRHAGRALLGGGLAFLGYLALLCQTLAACGQSVGCRKAAASMQQYEQLPVQEETHEVRKGPEPPEGGPVIVELTASTGNTV